MPFRVIKIACDSSLSTAASALPQCTPEILAVCRILQLCHELVEVVSINGCMTVSVGRTFFFFFPASGGATPKLFQCHVRGRRERWVHCGVLEGNKTQMSWEKEGKHGWVMWWQRCSVGMSRRWGWRFNLVKNCHKAALSQRWQQRGKTWQSNNYI